MPGCDYIIVGAGSADRVLMVEEKAADLIRGRLAEAA